MSNCHQARIILLENQNRDYKNIITLLHRKLNSNRKKDDKSSLQHDQTLNFLNEKFHQFEKLLSVKLPMLKSEMHYNLVLNEVNLTHQLEVSNYKAKINQLTHSSLLKLNNIITV